MRYLFTSLIVFFYYVTAASSSRSAIGLEARYPSISEPLPPSKDPWYQAPAHFEVAAPGTVLRIRRAPGNLSTIVSNCSAAYNILYRTTDARFRASWAVTTLFIPSTQQQNSSTSYLLSLQYAWDSASLDGSSYYLLYNMPAEVSLTNPGSSTADISYALNKGWSVVVPDYEGPLASFGLGIQAGHAVVDSVRAALSSNLIPNPQRTKYALWGYSGGSIASEWAVELQESYAPELSFAGAALGGLVSNMTAIVDLVDGGAYAGLLPSGIVGITTQFPEVYDYVQSRLNPSGPYNASTFFSTKNLTITQAAIAFGGQNITAYFKGGKADILAPQLLDVANRNLMMGFHGIPTMPIFSYHAIADEIAPTPVTDILMERYCEIGVNLWYQRNLIGGHSAEIINGRQRALDFLESVFNGEYNKTGCLIENVSVGILNVPF